MSFANGTTNATSPLMSISYYRDGETRYVIDSPPLYELIYVIVALIVSVVLGTSLGVQRSRLRVFDVMTLPLQHPFTMLVAGPTGCGKTRFTFKLIENASRIVQPSPRRIVYDETAERCLRRKRRCERNAKSCKKVDFCLLFCHPCCPCSPVCFQTDAVG